MAAKKIVAAQQSFSSQVNGVPRVVQKGDLYYDDDPMVAEHAKYFGAPKVKSTRGGAARVEQATAGPGEIRGG